MDYLGKQMAGYLTPRRVGSSFGKSTYVGEKLWDGFFQTLFVGMGITIQEKGKLSVVEGLSAEDLKEIFDSSYLRRELSKAVIVPGYIVFTFDRETGLLKLSFLPCRKLRNGALNCARLTEREIAIISRE